MPLPKSGSYAKNGVVFNFDFSFSYKVKKMYYGNFQPIISETLRRYLRKGDTLIDVGANIGYFSFVGAGLVGRNGQVHSFEPVPEYFKRLNGFASLNKDYNIKVNQMAVGSENNNTKIFIKGGGDIGNNTFYPFLLEQEKYESSIDVPVIRLDDYIEKNKIANIKVIKIDVEGFEFPALLGLEGYFKTCVKQNSYPIIICEIVPEVYSKQKYSLQNLLDYMARFSYHPFDILNNNKRLDLGKTKNAGVFDIVFKNTKND